MFWALTMAILLAGTGDLVAIVLGRQSWRYLLKAGTLFLIIALAATGLPEAGLYGYLVLAGLCFSVLGDIFLVMPADRFLPGLVSFFLAHLCYIAAFGAVRPITWADALVALGLMAVGLLFFWRLKPGVVERGGPGLVMPVALYVTVIPVMLLRAVLTGSPLAMAGAGLFYLSDAILAWDRFVRPFPGADLGVMATYFSAQYLIALTVITHAM